MGTGKVPLNEIDFYGSVRSQIDMSKLPWDKVKKLKNLKKANKNLKDDEVDATQTYLSPTLSYKRATVQGFLKKEAD